MNFVTYLEQLSFKSCSNHCIYGVPLMIWKQSQHKLLIGMVA